MIVQKPYRFVVSRVSSYAEEGGAFLRRRRLRAQPFARAWRDGGEIVALDGDSEQGRRIFLAAARVIEQTRP